MDTPSEDIPKELQAHDDDDDDAIIEKDNRDEMNIKRIEAGISIRRQQPHRSGKKRRENDIGKKSQENNIIQPPPKKKQKGISTQRQQPHRSGKKRRENDIIQPPPKKKKRGISTRRQPHRSAKKQLQLDSDKDEHKDIPSMVEFQPNTAMEMKDVIKRMLELDLVTPTQVALPGFSIRLAEKSDLSASTKKELQQQVLRLCQHSLLARWVLQDDDDSRVLEIVRCSGIEGHHKTTRSSWVNEKSSPTQRNHKLYNGGPKKKDSFLIEDKWLFKMCSRKRAGPVDRAPLVHGVQQNVECLILASNGCHLAFGAPTKDAMNGEIKLTTGVLGLNTQDGVDRILNTPIFNDGSNGKLVLLLINIEEPSKLKPMLHAMSNRKKKSTFMAAKNVTLAGNRTSDQSRALEKKIHRMQIAHYKKSLGLLTKEQRQAHSRVNGLLYGSLGYKKSLALLTSEQHRTNGLLGYEKCLRYLTKEQRRANRLSDGQWMGMYQKLVAYKKQHKSTDVPRGYAIDPQLAHWVHWQRNTSRNGISIERINLLESIGFAWDKHEAQWIGMYQKLVAYKKQYRTTKVPQHYTEDPQLGKWVSYQRTSYKKNKLKDKRTELLNSVNFIW